MAHEQRLTATDRLQRRLEADIVTGVLAPGVRIKPSALAPRYGVSVTPFREALARLQTQGLVEIDAFVGARVAGISPEEVVDLFAVRLRLEPPALQRAVELAGDGPRSELRQAFKRLRRASPEGTTPAAGVGRWLEAHREFHWALVAGTDSGWSLRLLRTIYDHLDRYQALAWSGGWLRAGSLDEHTRLFELHLAGEAAAACEALESHLESALAHIVTVLGGQPNATE